MEVTIYKAIIEIFIAVRHHGVSCSELFVCFKSLLWSARLLHKIQFTRKVSVHQWLTDLCVLFPDPTVKFFKGFSDLYSSIFRQASDTYADFLQRSLACSSLKRSIQCVKVHPICTVLCYVIAQLCLNVQFRLFPISFLPKTWNN